MKPGMGLWELSLVGGGCNFTHLQENIMEVPCSFSTMG